MSPTTVQAVDLKAISERYFSAWEKRDPDAIVSLHTEETWFWSHLGGAPVVGREAVRDTFAGLFETFRVLVRDVSRPLRRGTLGPGLGADIR